MNSKPGLTCWPVLFVLATLAACGGGGGGDGSAAAPTSNNPAAAPAPNNGGGAGAGTPTQGVARYNGPGNDYDSASALAVDAAGNVYVTGSSNDSDSSSDYATIKYDANGNQLWEARYGPENQNDSASALAVDAAGNVYVTGHSEVSFGSRAIYATVKYDTNGNQLWVALYNGPGNGLNIATDLAVDATGNVYVTGYSAGSGTSFDYATVKYDSNGNELWVARYAGLIWFDGMVINASDYASGLAVDVAGNVYVTGTSGTGIVADYATVKYDANGNQLWVARYNGPDGSDDSSRAIAVDAAGNVYVTGTSNGLGPNADYATIKYDPNGNRLWVARYNGPGPGNAYDSATALAVDAAGNVYVTGHSAGSGTSADCATVKYDTNGNQLWVARYNGPGNNTDAASALAADAAGNVYVTGYVYVTGPNEGATSFDYDYATIKYGANGNELWVARYNGPVNGDDHGPVTGEDFATDLVVDATGNVYVTGRSYGSGTYLDYATIKYSAP